MFTIASAESKEPVAYLQLDVERGGIDKVGFSVKEAVEGVDVHTRLWAPEGSVILTFDKLVVEEEVPISVWHGEEPVYSTTFGVGSTGGSTPALELRDVLSVRLKPVRELNRDRPFESGGTSVIDIIAEPPG
ncbi:MAG: hypothetical protein HC897_18310 [Thermoanaerobaculia bacterium]|nr:hypothetical protein [Thermoanaerobaculia bacterium]